MADRRAAYSKGGGGGALFEDLQYVLYLVEDMRLVDILLGSVQMILAKSAKVSCLKS